MTYNKVYNEYAKNKAVDRQYRRQSSQTTGEQYSLRDSVEIRSLLRCIKSTELKNFKMVVLLNKVIGSGWNEGKMVRNSINGYKKCFLCGYEMQIVSTTRQMIVHRLPEVTAEECAIEKMKTGKS